MGLHVSTTAHFLVFMTECFQCVYLQHSDSIFADCRTDHWGLCWCRYFHAMPTNCYQSTTRRRCSSTRRRARWETGVIRSTFPRAGRPAPHHWETNISGRSVAKHFHTACTVEYWMCHLHHSSVGLYSINWETKKSSSWKAVLFIPHH